MEAKSVQMLKKRRPRSKGCEDCERKAAEVEYVGELTKVGERGRERSRDQACAGKKKRRGE